MTTNNKIALVTGGSRGLGRDMAINLAKKGLDIIITYHQNASAAEEVIQEIKSLGQTAKAYPLDTRNISSFDQLIVNFQKDWGVDKKIDFLINNAGTGLYQKITDTTEEQFDDQFQIHFKGVYFFTQKWIPYLNHGGGIVNISSGLTRVSFVGSSAYACMKGAIETFTKYLAKELGEQKIRANVIAPGAIATDFGGGSNRDNEEKRTIIAGATALGRVGEATDIGSVVAFLCTPEANWINAQRIEVSGGMLV